MFSCSKNGDKSDNRKGKLNHERTKIINHTVCLNKMGDSVSQFKTRSHQMKNEI